MSTQLDIRILWWFSIAIQLWIAFSVLRGRLGAFFRFFGLYLAVSSALSICLFLVDSFSKNKNYYGYLFLFWTYCASIFEFLVIREVSSLALDRFPAIRAASRMTLSLFWAVLILIGGAWYVYLRSLPSLAQRKTALIYAALHYEQSVALGFTLFIFLFLAFVAWMPVPLSRNLLNHCFLTGAYFLVITLSRFSVQLGAFATQRHIADYIGLIGTLLVFATWAFRIRSNDDNQLNTPKGPLDPIEAKVMLARLEELNESLAKSGPKVFR